MLDSIHAKIQFDVRNSYLTRDENKGTQQHRVISPALCFIVMNKILGVLDRSAMKVVAYADNLEILV